MQPPPWLQTPKAIAANLCRNFCWYGSQPPKVTFSLVDTGPLLDNGYNRKRNLPLNHSINSIGVLWSHIIQGDFGSSMNLPAEISSLLKKIWFGCKNISSLPGILLLWKWIIPNWNMFEALCWSATCKCNILQYKCIFIIYRKKGTLLFTFSTHISSIL